MRNRFDRQLKTLNDELIEMGNMIEKSIEKALVALITQNVEKAKKVIAYDAEIDRQEREIESLCMKLLLQQQPVASDLRLISSALKMITDMERIGDQAADIAELAIFMADKPYIKDLKHINQMGQETMVMVASSVDAFVEKNLQKAQKVLEHDDIVDELFNEIKKELIEMIHVNKDIGEQAADLLMVAKYFERIGDHATNIAEWVIYSITGKHEQKNQEKHLTREEIIDCKQSIPVKKSY